MKNIKTENLSIEDFDTTDFYTYNKYNLYIMMYLSSFNFMQLPILKAEGDYEQC